MARRTYRLSPQALSDLEGIADYLGQRNPPAAVRVLDSLLEAFQLLSRPQLELGVRRDDLHPGINLFVPPPPADSYIIFFYHLPNGVEISDVIHGSRDWVGMLSRGER